ncbi:uncharacterized protein LOC123674047 [Harmonia axyridis]|uniref:uncharacterized protein LOC123674047 n=1 Tax=Harmonia axyridis TaxID=115357 RepID=UPI001E274F51|nr:uncharacterized protein LOC123674047 [Harmonia axyridis]
MVAVAVRRVLVGLVNLVSVLFSVSCYGDVVLNDSMTSTVEYAKVDVTPSSPLDAENELCNLRGEFEELQLDYLNLTMSHVLFKSDALTSGIVYQVKVNRIRSSTSIDILLTSKINGTSVGVFSARDKVSEMEREEFGNCQGIGKFQTSLEEGVEDITVNWSFHRSEGHEVIFGNITLQLNYQLRGSKSIYRVIEEKTLLKDCQLYLYGKEAVLSNKDLPTSKDCEVWFPNQENYGVIVELSRLNIPCSKGYLHFAGLNTSQQQHYRSRKQSHLCGKLEELPESDRRIYFPVSHTPPLMRLMNDPVFTLSYHLVDYCYNITFLTRNGSFELKPTGELMCTFKIYLPHGNRVALTLHIGDSSAGKETSFPSFEEPPLDEKCDGLETQLYDSDNKWFHCTRPGDSERQIEIVSRGNRVTLQVAVRGIRNGALGLRMTYRAEPIEEIVGLCEFGWVALRQFCISTVEGVRLPWAQAEMECIRRGGHLASVRSEHGQNIVNGLLLNSPGYRDDNAYWIGASDKTYEGDFRWSDGLPFSYSNWFPGWSQHGQYNRQPNDDGLSDQDCVEVRRIYSLPTSVTGLANNFMWNDRDCSTPNYFICEKLQNDEPLEDTWPLDCNKTITLTRQHPRALVSSPGFPRHYPDNVDCNTYIISPPGYQILLDFEELVLENEPTCSYDYLEILENGIDPQQFSSKNQTVSRRLCGDWSAKLKLLRYISSTSKLILKFSSDYSHHFGGYKARVSMENVVQCADDRHHIFNNSCYLFVTYPEVTWSTAQHICQGIKANLASVLTADEERFVISNLRKTPEYRTSSLYWLGGRLEKTSGFIWVDNSPVEYLGWLPSQKPLENMRKGNETAKCLGVQWTPSPSPTLPSGLYWKPKRCNSIGGYICKRANLEPGLGINFNKTVNGSEGIISSPNYPGNYYNNLDVTVNIIGPKRTRLVFKFERIDVEAQMECLYDHIDLRSLNENGNEVNVLKLCGSHDVDMHRFDYVSETNRAVLRFHSDYSIAGAGFSLRWHSVDITFCPIQTLTAKEGFVTSPNYPDFLLPHLNCTLVLQAPYGHKVWFEFLRVDLGKDTDDQNFLEMRLGEEIDFFRPFSIPNLLTEGSFLSYAETMQIRLRSGVKTDAVGFKAHYKMVNVVQEEKNVFLHNDTSGMLLHLNYPESPQTKVDFMQHFIAPLGSAISLELYHLKLTNTDCYEDNGLLEIYDNYADRNGTVWKLCYDPPTANAITPVNRIEITSFFNTLHLRQISGRSTGISLNGSIKILPDEEFKTKILKFKNEVESCNPNPCRRGGKCITKENRRFCECAGHFTGIFCALTKCDLDPCVFGTCDLTQNAYKCHCQEGYSGPTCEQKRRPCEGNPCESRGLCMERGEGFICRCHAWWEGPRCERRMLHIPYKPLSERMLHEPFWLGLMTVFVVMAVIGLVWCAKRHFPEKIEKLLAEENERNRSTLSSLRSASVREQLVAASSTASGQGSVTVTPSPGPGAPRSLFGRLGIRKPSILSLTSPHANSCYSPATARTFSLDDLLKPSPRRSPSPKKKRNNSTPTKKNAAEKKQILQQLVSPNNKQLSRKVSLGELMQMNDRHPGFRTAHQDDDHHLTIEETKFIENDTTQAVLNDPKLEKKVHFARLLNKVSAEMSSGSEMELGIMQNNKLGCAFMRPSSTPPSPCIDTRSPNSTSSNQGSDSFSSDLAIPSALSSSISDLLIRRHCSKLPNGRQKPTSADSILAMFRNFSSSSAGANLPPSLKVSPSTTPTASSPQDDIVGDDESSTSSIHTPVSFSSGAPESPVPYGHNPQSTIEIPVLDTLSAHKFPSSGSNLLHPPTILLEIPSTINKCLSPIRELPTPLPSPALTPIMRRSAANSSIEDNDLSDDKISVELPNISISCSDIDEDDMHCCPDINVDMHAEDGLIVEEVAVMQQNMYKTKNRPPPLGQTSDSNQESGAHVMVIPTLMVETPSPTYCHSPSISFPGSPPPFKSDGSNCFQFPPPSKPQRKMLKEFDKPTSLDLPCGPPMITITCNMSEVESDAESISPAVKSSMHLGASTSGMTYLSPFSMGTRGDQHASESNLSSSGYSSMASPGPSRCGSSNPLCPSEMEDQGPPGSGHSHRRPSPILKTNPHQCGDGNLEKSGAEEQQRRGRSDSETLSDDPMMESNDEGISTDHLEEKIEEGKVKSAKDLEMLMSGEVLIDLSDLVIPVPNQPKCKSVDSCKEKVLSNPSCSKNLLQLPSIVVQCDEKHLSPMSSRSESPLSDRTSRFSPDFSGKNRDLLLFTDSDGLYDFQSSGNSTSSTIVPLKKTGKRREKKTLRNCKTPSPTKTFQTSPSIQHHLGLPSKETKMPPPRKLSPKRRMPRNPVISSSSSSDSVTSTKEVRLSSSSPSPDTIRWSSSMDWMDFKKSKCLDVVKTPEETTEETLPKAQELKKNQKLSKLRAISHQIRFLRRLETSLKRRDRSLSPSDSFDSDGGDSPKATSPLLQHKGAKNEIRKSSSIGKLSGQGSSRSRRGKYKRGELLSPRQDSWKMVLTTGNGHSD